MFQIGGITQHGRRGNLLKFVLLSIISVAIGKTTQVLGHGKMVAPMGLNVDPKVSLSSQADVSIGATGVSPCGTTLGRAFDRNDTKPRANYYPGQKATATWHTVNQDGAGPLRVRFSGDSGRSWTDADVSNNIPGVIGLDASSLPIVGKGQDHQIQFTVPNMNCQPGQCMMLVSNPITFGSCVPVSIQQGNKGDLNTTYKSTGGDKEGKAGQKGIMAGGIGGLADTIGSVGGLIG